ncbi:NADP-dependent oxidoreductase [Pseudarthrobacter enclensis]|uniref:NADPH:quinone reductase-like Zn-dependent oxidoreductase n=1 Tax=Pseudarthrobacter enclensis TaxID=993070 RepID=A0ABT9RXN3_9MICC|nr:NADP-dependent oxidoreductase [Pseudarthrobacter enclensis]MDP9889997.1 NADPH:quinone reductase-like Zn-dependent oxidoreductase [Pseudarthrobacter enclensis]
MSVENQSRMRAVSPAVWGPPEVLREIEVDRPSPQPGEVLVRVQAIGVNPTDWKSRATGGRKLWKNPPILGFDVSGVVEEVAEGSVLFRPGDEVFGMPLFPQQAGAYAEYVAGPARQFARKPTGLDHVHAAALPLAGLTAWQSLVDAASVRAGQRVLIHAAAGGVGHLAVQIAKALGAYVIGTARGSKHEFVRGLGADEVLDYTETDIAQSLDKVDIVIDPIGGETGQHSIGALRPGGILVSLIPRWHAPTSAAASAAGVRYILVVVEPDGEGLKALGRLVDSGELRPHVSAVLPLSDARTAHQMGETGRTTGKIVLTP